MSDKRTFWLLVLGMTVVLALFVPLSSSLFGVRYDYTLTTVALGGAILGSVTGVIGCFVVLRQQSLLGDSLSHAALPGVCIAFLLFGRELGWLLLGAGVAGWLGVLMIYAITGTTRIKQDTALAVVLTMFFASGIALLAYIQGRPDASQAGLDKFIFGQAAAIIRSEVILMSIIGLILFVLLAIFWKEFKLITFDPGFARANGHPARMLEILLSTMVVVAVVLGLQMAGVILMVGMLIAPAVSARQWTNDLGQMTVLAGLFGAFSGAFGAIISGIDAGLATGPLIIVAAFAIVLISLMFAPGRGLVWASAQRRKNRRQFAATNVLRDIYAYIQNHDGDSAPQSILLGARGVTARLGLRQLQQRDWAIQKGDSWYLTHLGEQQARQLICNKRLWEIYRVYSDELDLPIIPEDMQRDIRELLPEDAVNRLERKLEVVA